MDSARNSITALGYVIHCLWCVAASVTRYPGHAVDFMDTFNTLRICETSYLTHLYSYVISGLLAHRGHAAVGDAVTPQGPKPTELTTDFYEIEYFSD